MVFDSQIDGNVFPNLVGYPHPGVQFGIDESGESVSIQDSEIMIIDDDIIQARQISEKLSVVNKSIKLQTEPENAISEAAQGNYDVIIVSTQMI